MAKRTAYILIIIFVAATIIMTYPLSFRMKTHIPGWGSTDEPYSVIWHYWWFRYSHQNRLNYADCRFVAFPFGYDLSSNAGSSFLWEGLANSLTMLTNEVTTYNLLVLLSFFLTLIFTYILVFYLTGSTLVSIFSAFIFAFCPYHFARAWQHLSLSQIQWIPLYVLSLFKLKDSPNKRIVLFSALSLFLAVSFNPYYGYFLLILTGLFMLYFIVYNRTPASSLKLIKRIILMSIIAGVLLSPLFIDVYKIRKGYQNTPQSFNLLRRSFGDLFTQSAKPLSYALPAVAHPIFGKFTERFIGSPLYGVSFTEHTLYLGWVPIVLSLVAYRTWRRRRKDYKSEIRNPKSETNSKSQITNNYQLPITNYQLQDFYIGFFVWLAIAAWLFSQPPYFSFPHFKLYMPSFFLYKLLPMFRAYCRFGVVVMFAVSVLAGFGLKFILERFKNNRGKIALTCLFTGLVLFEFLNFPPFKVIDLTKYPSVYDWLKLEKGDFAVAEYPLDTEGPNEYYRFCQIIHKKRLINATLPGTYANNIAKTIWKLSGPRTVRMLSWMKVKYVLVHLDIYEKSNDVGILDELEKIKTKNIAGLKYIRTFDDVYVYEVIK